MPMPDLIAGGDRDSIRKKKRRRVSPGAKWIIGDQRSIP